MKVPCEFSTPDHPHDVETSGADAYRKEVGYERRRAAGGTNAIHQRRPTDTWCCGSCMRKLARNLNPAQEALL